MPTIFTPIFAHIPRFDRWWKTHFAHFGWLNHWWCHVFLVESARLLVTGWTPICPSVVLKKYQNILKPSDFTRLHPPSGHDTSCSRPCICHDVDRTSPSWKLAQRQTWWSLLQRAAHDRPSPWFWSFPKGEYLPKILRVEEKDSSHWGVNFGVLAASSWWYVY